MEERSIIVKALFRYGFSINLRTLHISLYYIMRHIIVALLIISCLLASTDARRRKEVIEEVEEPLPDELVQVQEANHFESQTERQTQFKAENLVEDKPLMFLLEPNQLKEETNVTFIIEENPITVTIEAGNERQTCEMTNFYSLCSIPKVTVKEATIKASCKSTPCEMRWRIQQPETVEIDGQHQLNHLVSVNQDKNHAILKVYCTNPELKQELPSSITLYTNSAFEEVLTAEEELVYLFNNQKKGQYFITSTNEAVEGCAEVTLEHAIEDIDLKAEGVIFHDFFSNKEVNTYELTSKPTTDLMMEMLLHEAGMGEFLNQTGITVKLIGITNHQQTTLHELSLVADDEKQFIDFSTVFKKPSSDFEKYELHLTGITQQTLIATINFKATNTPQVQFQQESWFDLKKGDKIDYKLVAIDKDVDNIDKQNLFVSDKTKFNLSKESCGKEGCEFTVEAIEDGKGFVYIGEDMKAGNKEIVLEEFEKSIKKKIRQGEELFYEYKIGANKAVQMVINSPSTVVYVADKTKCKPKELSTCYQKQFNSHNPTFYEAKEATEVAFKVVGLDNCEFTMTMIDSNEAVIELKDTEPFAYLMDNNEHELVFGFKLDKKEDVSFNLIGPLNQLTLAVFNKEKLGKQDSTAQSKEAEISMDGYVAFEKEDLKSNFFVIKVEKREEYRKKYVHFTLIASTKEANLRLETGNAHYETLKSGAERDYVFEIIPQNKMFLNFYTHNLQNGINLEAILSPTDEYNNKDATITYKIDRQTDVIEVGTAAEKLCAAESQHECEIFLRIRNHMQVQVDVTITLLVSQSIIELKDGIWQTYDINEAAATSHFYYFTKHKKHSITIFYHSANVDLKIAYSLWQSDDTSINPSQWPFPYQYNETNPSPSPLAFKPTRFIHIESSQLQQCWPNCVVLLSILPYKKELEQFQKKPVPFFNVNHDFKIMASSNYIEMPEKVKVDIILNRAQQKLLLVDLKYAKERESIVFFNYLTAGSVILKGNVYSQRNPRCPTSEQVESDFQFVGVETEIEVETINKKLEDNNMENDKNQYLCILAYAFVESKTSLEFVSEVSDIKSIPLDTTTAVTLRREETRIYQLNAHFEFFLKISRTSGFPYISRQLCNPKDDMEKCLEDFRNSDEKGQQLVNKIMSITETPCPSCMLFVKITAKEEANLTLHSQSRYAEVELKQNNPLTDVLAPGEINRYIITAHRDKEVILNIQILTGNIKMEMHDFGNVHINKENAKGSSNIHLVVPSKDQQEEAKGPGTTLVHSFGLSNFNQLHLSVQAQNPKEPANYIITYSNGEQITYLEDGLITQHIIRANQPTKFLYNSPGSPRVYLYLSAPDEQILSKVTPTVYGLNNPQDEDDKQELKIQKPTFMKKTVNPTMLVHLPGKLHYEIELQNKNNKDISLSIGINNQEIIYLPFDHEFPFKLEPKEYLYFTLPIANPGYVKFTMNKCSSCQPYIAFTEDYTQFLAENFESEQQITDGLTFQTIIHAKKSGGLYVKVRTTDEKESILTVKATFSTTKIVQNKAKAGDKGNIEYQLLDSTKAEVTYAGVVCDKNCNGQFAYSAITSPVEDKIISQLVCTSVSFDLLGYTLRDAPEVENISSARSDSKVSFNHTLKEHIEYLGIKAYNSKTGDLVYYPPVEIITFQGRIDKAAAIATQTAQGGNFYWILLILVLIVVCWMLIAYRRYKKKRQTYAPLNTDLHDTLDD